MKQFIPIAVMISVLLMPKATAQKEIKNDTSANKFLSTAYWLDNDLTFDFDREGHWSFNGIRLVADPQLGFLQVIGKDRLDIKQFTQIPKFGLETNLFRGYLGIQLLFVTPTLVTFDSKSEVIKKGLLQNSDNTVQLDFGGAIGFSLFDGTITIGAGYLNYDRRDFKETLPDFNSNYKWDWFTFVNFNILPFARLGLKAVK